MKRPNGWQRIGVVLSVVWALGAGAAQRMSDTAAAGRSFKVSFGICKEAADRRVEYGGAPLDIERCSDIGVDAWNVALMGSWPNVAAVAFIPIPFGWLFAYLLFWVGRWVARGFRKPRVASGGGSALD